MQYRLTEIKMTMEKFADCVRISKVKDIPAMENMQQLEV
jgi:hypothetical protein